MVNFSDTATLLDIIRLITGTIILSYASYTDIKTRLASNYLWIIMGVVGVIILVFEYFTVGFTNPYYLIFIPIMIALMYILFQLRLIFGGADAKAIMAIAILVPFPIYNLTYLGPSLMPGSWQVFANSVILFLLIPLSLFIFNILKRNIEFPFAFLGYKMSVSKAREKFVKKKKKIEDGKRKFVYMPKEFDIEEELKVFEKNNIKEIWVTPKIPFMIPLLFGFICTFILGDIMFSIMGFFI
jgi:preflagellin peptidase FlaK